MIYTKLLQCCKGKGLILWSVRREHATCWRQKTVSAHHFRVRYYTDQSKKSVFQFEIIINVLGSSFRFIQITMLWVYGH